jgi:hypothetical protein
MLVRCHDHIVVVLFDCLDDILIVLIVAKLLVVKSLVVIGRSRILIFKAIVFNRFFRSVCNSCNLRLTNQTALAIIKSQQLRLSISLAKLNMVNDFLGHWEECPGSAGDILTTPQVEKLV